MSFWTNNRDFNKGSLFLNSLSNVLDLIDHGGERDPIICLVFEASEKKAENVSDNKG